MRGRHSLGGPYLPIRCACAPNDVVGGPYGTRRVYSCITVDGEPECPAEPHPKCVALDKVSVTRWVTERDKQGLLYGPDDTLEPCT